MPWAGWALRLLTRLYSWICASSGYCRWLSTDSNRFSAMLFVVMLYRSASVGDSLGLFRVGGGLGAWFLCGLVAIVVLVREYFEVRSVPCG